MVSELEKKRLENIQRNQKLLREFQLRELSNATFGEPKKPETKPKKKRVKRDWSQPPVVRRVSRRLLRLQGDEDEEKRLIEEAEKRRLEEEERKEAERTRREGELKLPELVGDGKWEQALEILSGLDGKVSQGDYFQDQSEDSIANLTLDERDIKIIGDRITAIAFHPEPRRKLVLAGDKMGEIGVWDPSKQDDTGLVSFRKAHTRAIATIEADPVNASKVYSSSYDGSIRLLDLTAQSSTDVFVFDAPPATARDPVGISDFSIVDPSTLYYTTLDGRFGICDLRQKSIKCEPRQLHEKKIGGFAVNPSATHQIATASLDRTLKIWDIRKGESFLYGEYSSRLSISAASWNSDGQIVCNGYDDTICIFDLAEAAKWTHKTENDTLTPSVKLKHNCQTGRWVSILKARWQKNPRDGTQKFVIGNMKRYADIYSGNGQQLAHLGGDIVTAVPAVAQFHPTENWVVGGTASGKVYLYT